MNVQEGNDNGCRCVYLWSAPQRNEGSRPQHYENGELHRFQGYCCDRGRRPILQDVYPTSKAYGGAGRFRFDPPAHLTEISPLLTQQSFLKLLVIESLSV